MHNSGKIQTTVHMSNGNARPTKVIGLVHAWAGLALLGVNMLFVLVGKKQSRSPTRAQQVSQASKQNNTHNSNNSISL